MLDLFVFAVIGLLAGAAARVWYPGREPLRVVGTMLVGMTGSLLGGLLSWAVWPDEQLHAGALLMSLLGGVLVIAVWAFVAYARGNRVPRPLVP